MVRPHGCAPKCRSRGPRAAGAAGSASRARSTERFLALASPGAPAFGARSSGYERPRTCCRWWSGMDQNEKSCSSTSGATRNQGAPATTITMATSSPKRRLPLTSQTSTSVSRRARRRSTLGGNPSSLRHHGFALTPPYCPMPLQRAVEPNRAAARSVVRRERRGSRSEVPIDALVDAASPGPDVEGGHRRSPVRAGCSASRAGRSRDVSRRWSAGFRAPL